MGQEKYRNQRCQKQSREKLKTKRDHKPKASQEDEDDSIASLLKRISADISTMKGDLKVNNQKIDSVNDKINDIEVNAEKAAKANKLKFEMINGKVARIETNITDKVIEKIDPQIKNLKSDLRKEINDDLKSLVTEEFAQRFPEKTDGERNEDEPIEDNSAKKANSEEVVKLVEEALAKRLPPKKAAEDTAHSEDSETETGEPEKK